MSQSHAYEFEPLTGPAWRSETGSLGRETWHRVRSPLLSVDVCVRLGVGVDGRLGCTGVLIGGPDDQEVTTRAIRTVQLGAIMTAAASYLSGEGVDDPLAREVMKHIAKVGLNDTAGVMATSRQRPGPKGHDRAHYERVVAAYREAVVRSPRSPVPETARILISTPSTVRRWLKTARDLGIAGASTPGRAGEQP